jgi:hypothetical protein
MIISRTPYRVSFFGGGTDYPAWYREHGGAVLATTIDKYCIPGSCGASITRARRGRRRWRSGAQGVRSGNSCVPTM